MDYLDLAANLTASPWYYVLAGVLGAVFGSFSGVLIERLVEGRSIKTPSACASCGTPVRPWQNIPIVSYLVLRGRCASCKDKIPMRLLAVEAVTAIGWIMGVALVGDPVGVLAFGMFTCFAVVLGVIDFRTSYIPWGPYLWFGSAAWIATAASTILTGEVGRLWLGLGVGFGTALALELIAGLFYLLRGKAGMGHGDTLLIIVAAGVPVALSGNWVVGIYGAFLAFVLGAVGGVLSARKYDDGISDPYLQEAPETEDGEVVEVSVGQRIFALGPYLLLGPVLMWLIVAVTGWNPLGV